MRRALAMMAVCAGLAGCSPAGSDAEGRPGPPAGVWVDSYVDGKTGVEWLVFQRGANGLAVAPRQPLPPPPAETGRERP